MELPAKDVWSWHQVLFDRALTIGTKCVGAATKLEGESVVRQLLARRSLRTCFGAPLKTMPLPAKNSNDFWDRWLLHLWGRRCYRYLSALTNGLAACRGTSFGQSKSKELTQIIPALERLCKALHANFIRGNPRSTPSSSLREREDIANFHLTYIDPILFSALHILHDPDVSLEADDKQMLWKLIKSEVIKHTKNGAGKSDNISDESTTWWGLTSLISEERNSFSLGPNRRYRGYHGAAQVCLNLIRAKDGKVSFPSIEDVWTEATPEIYGETRTRLLIAKNCAQIILMLRPHLDKEALSKITGYLVEHFLYVRGEGDDDVQRHIALLGFALETSCALLQLVGNSELRRKDKVQSQNHGAARRKTGRNPRVENPVFVLTVSRSRRAILLNQREIPLASNHYFLLFTLVEQLQQDRTKDVTFKEFYPALINVMERFRKENWFRTRENGTLSILKRETEATDQPTTRLSQLIHDTRRALMKTDKSLTKPLIEALPRRGSCALRLKPEQVGFSNT